MIWHFLEVWGLLLVAFAAGCLLGTLFYMAIAASPLAGVQMAAADSIGGVLGGFPRRGGGRVGAYPRPAEAEPYAPSAPQSPDAYPAAYVTRGKTDAAPVESTATAIDGIQEPLEADWEAEAYWDEEGDPDPAPDGTTPSTAFPVEASMPVGSAAVSHEPELLPELPAMRPLTLPGPRNGVPDNLQRIRGIGHKNEEILNGLGIYHFGQIAAWTPAEARWIASHLAFPERIERDDWIGQAIILATGGDTGYVKATARRKRDEEPPPVASNPI